MNVKANFFFILIALLVALAPVPAHAQHRRAYKAGELIVKLKGKQQEAGSSGFLTHSRSKHHMRLKHSWGEMNLHHFSLAAGEDMQTKLNELNNDPNVEFAEPNYLVNKSDIAGIEGIPDSLAVGQQKIAAQGVSALSTSGSYGLSSADIHVAETWPLLKNDGSYIIVAVIDTGLDMTHPVFTGSNAIWTNPSEIASNGIDDDHNGYIDDVHGWNWVANSNNPTDDDSHGTHVSGVILGTSQNIFTSPLQPAKIKIMPLKFLDRTGSGSVADAVQAIYYGVNNGARVLSNSWGGSSTSSSLLQAISYAYNHNVVFVAAAGNSSSNNDQVPMYPANYNVPGLIAVAASTFDDLLAYFSNFGATTVHISSPGVSIYSTLPGATYGYMSGTSMATPFISGTAALIVREQPTITSYQVKNLILGSGVVFSSFYQKNSTSARFDEKAAVLSSQSASIQSTQPSYTPTISDGSRSPASSSAGCGLIADRVHKMGGGNDDDFNNPSWLQVGIFGAIVLLPLLLHALFRQLSKAQPAQRRRYERFRVDSKVRVRVGDQELIGSVSSLSLGGVQLNTDAMLKQGGMVTMMIKSPDGQELQIEGKVVWSAEQSSYGIQFANATDAVRTAISRWTRSLAS